MTKFKKLKLMNNLVDSMLGVDYELIRQEYKKFQKREIEKLKRVGIYEEEKKWLSKWAKLPYLYRGSSRTNDNNAVGLYIMLYAPTLPTIYRQSNNLYMQINR